MDIERTALPGIGLSHALTTARGRRLAVVSHHSGRRDLVVYERDDPDTALTTVSLSAAESNAVAELLGTTRVVEHLAELRRQVAGLTSAQVPISAGSPYAGRTLGETEARSRTGASIVAVVRGPEVIVGPTPPFVFEPGDVVVAVGTDEATAAVTAVLTGG